jgi:Fe-S-cluster containining protein
MKNQILDIIYSEFEKWSANENFCCRKGCAVCCTQNVTITALEGVKIIEFCQKNDRESWLANKLSNETHAAPPLQTTNEYIAAFIEGCEVEQVSPDTTHRCPFLENDICTIYPVRPLSCRCFGSQKQCAQHGSALLPNHYLSASLAVMQIIEHLGQFEYWGNMADVLLSLCDYSSYRNIATALENPTLMIQARLRTLNAKPIPGFSFPEEDIDAVSPLIGAIFQTKIGEKNIEQILNGQ